MTLKEAFEMLAKSTKKGMKNPFFVLRNLSQNFAEIAKNVEGGGGGDKVTVTQTITDGTEIGSIKVNDNTTKLYAPAGGGGGGGGIDYSTTEQDTGLKWIDSKPIYQRTYDFGQNYDIPNSNATSFNLDGITTFETIIKCYGTSSSGIYQGDIIINNNNGIADGIAVRNQTASVRYLTVMYTKKTT